MKKDSVAALIAALGDPKESVRSAAAEALGELGGKDAVQALRRALADEDAEVVVAAQEALAKLGCGTDPLRPG